MIDDNAIATCVPCRVGSYQPNSGQTVCMQCPDGFTTAQEGAIEKSQCQGRHQFGPALKVLTKSINFCERIFLILFFDVLYFLFPTFLNQ